ncbi:MAG TPA: hypothetical protein VNU20_05905 [Candidatus Sulfotelmatobacter sp.]|jgi:hypothetical protein|nr:hypothetical protein [Candidatus Sulfotelmatobacter sp.]
MRKLNETWKNKRERGVALLFAIFTLLLVSAIAASLVFVANTETSVNSNYRAERVSAFSAKSGMEEIRDRMSLPTTDPRSLANLLPGQLAGNPVPAVFPPAANSVLYVVNEGTAAGTVKPWVAGNAYMDDELCHDFAGVQGQQPAPDVRCTTPPTVAVLVAGETAVAPFASAYPWAGTSAALTYKWVRITLKQSGSNQSYLVNATSPTTQVCWNGSNELLLNLVGNATGTCQGMAPSVACPTCASTNPVYMITALAVSSAGTTRKMVQAEVGLPPAQPFPYGMFATGTICPAISFSGGGNSDPATDSYNSKNGNYGGQNQFNTGGSVGANGGISLSGHAKIGGNVGLQSLPGGAQVPCAGGDYVTSGSAGLYNPNGNGPNPNVLQQMPAPVIFPIPPDPSPMPTSKSPQPTNPAVPGTYGDISLSGKTTLVLAPGVYNVNSLSLSGQSSITVIPAGAVVLNFPSSSQNPISLSGQGIASSSQIPNDMQLNYGGTGTVTLSGQGTSYALVDAPNSAMTVSGNGDFFGAVVGQTITYSGNGKFHYDTNTGLGPKNNGGYQLISYREVTY